MYQSHQQIRPEENTQSGDIPFFQAGAGKIAEDLLKFTRAFLYGASCSFAPLIGISTLIQPPSLSFIAEIGLCSGTISLSAEILHRMQQNPSTSFAVKKIAAYLKITNGCLHCAGDTGTVWNTFLLIAKQFANTSEPTSTLSDFFYASFSLMLGPVVTFSRWQRDHAGPDGHNINCFPGEMIRGMIAPTFMLMAFQQKGIFPVSSSYNGTKLFLTQMY